MRNRLRSEEIRKEVSVPVQSRIDIRSLAEVCQYFESSGVMVKTMSQLVSWAVEILVETLRRNEKIGLEGLGVEDAYQYLDDRVLMQRGMRNKKLLLGRGFEALRMEGEDPKAIASRDYKSIHNNPKWTGEVPRVEVPVENSSQSTGVDWEKIQEKIKREDEKEAREVLEESMERIKEAGLIDKSVMSEEGGVITPMGRGSSVVYQEDMDAYEKREEDRKGAEEDEKELKAVESAQEKLREKLYLMEVGEHEESEGKNGGAGEEVSGRNDRDSEGAEGEGTDTGTDSP